MIAFDASILIALNHRRTTEDQMLRLRALQADAERRRTKIVIPTPALAEYLAGAGAARATVYERLQQSKVFRIAPFGERAAYECAIMHDVAKPKASRRSEGNSWAKAKYDWQIVAIAKVEGVEALYTLDDDIVRLGREHDVRVIDLDAMPLPDAARQRLLELPDAQDDARPAPASNVHPPG
jgi:predicted nucleic acid-binding protein